ncbi:hypothetical protein [Ewingella americana]|uniref:hypothetical protein n=1 Tax=Ewingella americana TaxID=41202 RepID=UPI0012AE91C6|nr:hypothetical protein [Ewingella americana]MRT05947.1 hypothetical protein [Ewingella americana]
MLSLGIVNRSAQVDIPTNFSEKNLIADPLTKAMAEVAPNGCQLFHGTKVSVLRNMLESKSHPGALRSYGDLFSSGITVSTGEAGLQGGFVNTENAHSVSTCKKEDIAVSLLYAIRSAQVVEDYPVLFGINIDPQDKRVTEKAFTDIGAFSDCAVRGPIGPDSISMIMVPYSDLPEVNNLIQGTELESVAVTAFEDFFERASGWENTSNSSYDKLYETFQGQSALEHVQLRNCLSS